MRPRPPRLIRLLCVLAMAVAVAVASAERAAVAAPKLALERVFPKLDFRRPLALVQAPETPGRWYVVEQAGRVLTFADRENVERAAVAVDIRGRVDDGPNEAGLLGLAFHPDYPRQSRVFLSYTRDGSPLVSVISEFAVGPDGTSFDAGSERVILNLDQPYGNHNGGSIVFGPDGYLYIGFGDGGAGGDPRGNGQNTETLLGALLRLDVDSGAPYAIPPDNPFAEGGGAPEIYAYGLRNPWRYSFDRATGALWLADVGQDKWEEIDIIQKGGNYGWNLREGAHRYARGQASGPLIDPVFDYGHDWGCSITGGYIYRGRAIPPLDGVYVFGDYCSGRVWGLFDEDGGYVARRLLDSDINISSFGEGLDGELYVVDLSGGGLHRLAPAE